MRKKAPEQTSIRFTQREDAPHLKQWLIEYEANRWFAMSDDVEINDAVNRWISFHRYKCSLTCLHNNVPAGIATLFLQPYKTLAHQCEFGIIVGKSFRGLGIGSYLIDSSLKLAKDTFHIESVHLQVFAQNPAIKLYRKHGFREFGRQSHWYKKEGVYEAKVYMERLLP